MSDIQIILLDVSMILVWVILWGLTFRVKTNNDLIHALYKCVKATHDHVELNTEVIGKMAVNFEKENKNEQ